MKQSIRVALSALATVGVALGAWLAFGNASDPPAPPAAPEPPPNWKDIAAANTMPDRRAYTLPLNNPDMVPVDKAEFMKDDDVVLGIMIRGKARAYPWWLTSNYHVVNDTVDQDPVLITLCEVCGGAAAFRPTLPDLPGIPLSFQIGGVNLGTIEIVDHQTLSRWRPFLGCAAAGPLKGRALDNYPLLLLTWKEWRQWFPNSVVANGSPELRSRPHGAESGRIGDTALPSLFASTANLTDERMGRHEIALGIQVPETGKSYALPTSRLTPFPNLFLLKLGAKRVLVVRQGELAMIAFDLNQTAYGTDFTLVSKAPVSFRTPDGWTWNAFGWGTAPGKPGKQLPLARSYITEWYEWVSHSRDSEIVQAVEVVGDHAAAPVR
jgi:hypothetical protein